MQENEKRVFQIFFNIESSKLFQTFLKKTSELSLLDKEILLNITNEKIIIVPHRWTYWDESNNIEIDIKKFETDGVYNCYEFYLKKENEFETYFDIILSPKKLSLMIHPETLKNLINFVDDIFKTLDNNIMTIRSKRYSDDQINKMKKDNPDVNPEKNYLKLEKRKIEDYKNFKNIIEEKDIGSFVSMKNFVSFENERETKKRYIKFKVLYNQFYNMISSCRSDIQYIYIILRKEEKNIKIYFNIDKLITELNIEYVKNSINLELPSEGIIYRIPFGLLCISMEKNDKCFDFCKLYLLEDKIILENDIIDKEKENIIGSYYFSIRCSFVNRDNVEEYSKIMNQIQVTSNLNQFVCGFKDISFHNKSLSGQ